MVSTRETLSNEIQDVASLVLTVSRFSDFYSRILKVNLLQNCFQNEHLWRVQAKVLLTPRGDKKNHISDLKKYVSAEFPLTNKATGARSNVTYEYGTYNFRSTKWIFMRLSSSLFLFISVIKTFFTYFL